VCRFNNGIPFYNREQSATSDEIMKEAMKFFEKEILLDYIDSNKIE